MMIWAMLLLLIRLGGFAFTSATVRQTLEVDISTQYVPASSPEHDLIGASHSRTSRRKHSFFSVLISLFILSMPHLILWARP